MVTEGSQSQEIEMQEIEPPQPLNTPKTPKAATITMEVSSDSSTPGLYFYLIECTFHITLHSHILLQKFDSRRFVPIT